MKGISNTNRRQRLAIAAVIMLVIGAFGIGLITESTPTEDDVEPGPEPAPEPEPDPEQEQEPDPEPDPEPESNDSDSGTEPVSDTGTSTTHSVQFKPDESTGIAMYDIKIDSGQVCKTYLDESKSNGKDCEHNPELALDLLNSLDFYEDHDDVPYPPVNESSP